ncbi:potassium channel family protein [Phenylobacterium sp.]|uniref:potassium channel family protein n=1 Tax=Phenylobacterium sp. TaxID=1871053 RepID=UPI0027230F48|nr:potassium channel family protein [Phenylobacterium sp.]MDO8380390.1 ion channel [Phenylobacterium sp.]
MAKPHDPTPAFQRLRLRLRALFYGESRAAIRFRLGVIVLDLLLIGFFIATPMVRDRPIYLAIDYAIAVVVLVDLAARALAAPDLSRWLRRSSFWVDVVVLITLLFPLWLANFAFLRVLRLWSLFHSDFFWETVARRYDNTRWEETTKALATLVTYLFIVTGVVYALYARQHPHINGYVDALYFTVSTVTTTGFGDVTLPGVSGKLISILIMLSGFTLFVRLAQALLRPRKVLFPCPTCGLLRHDLDAVHCKACGQLLNIPNDEGP